MILDMSESATTKGATMNIEIRIDGETVESQSVDSMSERFYFGKATISPLLRAHGGVAEKMVDSGVVRFTCEDGTVVEEVIIHPTA
jgi:hypothetical protein